MSSKKQLIVWQIPLDIPEDRVESLISELSEPEKKQANRFRFAKHRRRYVAAHVAMRRILAEYLQVESANITICESEHRKPFIEAHPVFFNLSHSEELALLALNEADQVGVDLEFINSHTDVMGVASRFFNPLEIEQLISVPESERLFYFYRCWTAKEAFLKAKGVGIATHLKNFAVGFLDQTQIKILWADAELSEFSGWFAHARKLDEKYISTVVCGNINMEVDFKHWSCF